MRSAVCALLALAACARVSDADGAPMRAVAVPAAVAPGQPLVIELQGGTDAERAVWRPVSPQVLLLTERAAPRGIRRLAGVAATLEDQPLPGGGTLQVRMVLPTDAVDQVEGLSDLPAFRISAPARAAWTAALAAVVAAAAWLLLRRRAPPAAAPALAPPPEPDPRAEALARARALDPRAARTAHEVAVYCEALSGILRDHLARTHAIAAPRRTTEETLEAAERATLSARARVAAVLQACDRVKFSAASADAAARVALREELLAILTEEQP